MDKVEYNQPPPYGNGQNPPMPGIHIPPQQNFTNAQFSTNTRVIGSPQIVVIGACPSCKIGVLEDDFPCCAICLGICCFPVGLVCCYVMKNKRCTHCGTTFG